MLNNTRVAPPRIPPPKANGPARRRTGTDPREEKRGGREYTPAEHQQQAKTLPPPLVPPDVDLRGYDFMPFYGNHLLGSEFHAKASDTAWRAGVTLWWAAWNQVPAASLPDDDVALARLADLGRDVQTWRRLRHEALHGFIKCSDGKFYHKFLAPLAIEAWARRQDYQKRTLKARIAALEKRLRQAVTDGDREHLQSLLQEMKQGQSQTINQSVTDTGNGQLQGPTGTGTGTGTGQESTTAGRQADTASEDYPAIFEDIWQAYPKRLGDNPKRRAFSAYNARRKEGASPEIIRDGVKRYAAFVRAQGKEGTEFVKQAATFFGPDKPFLEAWASLPLRSPQFVRRGQEKNGADQSGAPQDVVTSI